MAKKIVLISIAVILLVLVGAIVIKKINPSNKFASAILRSNISVMVGSSSDLKKIPQSYVFSNTTTTDATYDGDVINQYVNTKGSIGITIYASGIASNATNTINFMFQVSPDNSNWFDLSNATTTTQSATSTQDLNPYVIAWLPGTATNTASFYIPVKGTDYMRILLKGSDNNDTDNYEKSQAWITVVKETEL